MKKYKIDSATRQISQANSKETLGVLNDNLLDGAEFELTGYAADMFNEKKPNLYIHYKLGNSDMVFSDQISSSDIAKEEDKLTFKWFLKRNATRKIGAIKFSVCMKLSDGREWGTAYFADKILESIEGDTDGKEASEFKTVYDEAVDNFKQMAEQYGTAIDEVKLASALSEVYS